MKIYYLTHTEPDNGQEEYGPYFLTEVDAKKAARYLERVYENEKYGLIFCVNTVELWSDADDFIKS